jgi:hypothetical protein
MIKLKSIALTMLLVASSCSAQIMGVGNRKVMHTSVGPTPILVQSNTTGTASDTGLGYSSPVTAGHALIATFYSGNGPNQSLTFTDSQGNAWTILKSASLETDGDTVAIGCAIAGSTGADTVSFNGLGGADRGTIYEYSNATCTQDVTAVSSNTTGVTSCNSGPLTTATANDLLVAACGDDGNQTTAEAAGSGWSNGLNAANAGSYFLMSETRVATTPGSYTATSAAFTTAMEQASIIVALKP